MSFCNLCKTIPWETLPLVPPETQGTLSGRPYIQQRYKWPKDRRGFKHHETFEALRSSAEESNCGLCRLIFQQVKSCKSELEGLKAGWEVELYDNPVWDFWIVQREGGGDGFWVMSFTDKMCSSEARLVAAIGLCVRDGDPLHSVIRGRPIEQQGGTPTEISRVRKWLKECDKHSSCSAGETVLPSRVLDVGDDINSPYVKLYETERHEFGKYIALSYCWGKSVGFITTKSTLEDRKRQIMISDLQKTHQDAIKLSRELGIKYLWIDSICICQDDYKNWEQESAQMLSIYSNAYLTVAAARAEDSCEGLFRQSSTREYVEFEYISHGLQGQALAFILPLREEAVSRDYIDQPNEPLSDRAWTLQERVLSRRTLLYGSQQMFFECNEGFRGEDGISLKRRFESVWDHSEESLKGLECHRDKANSKGNRCSNYEKAVRRSWHNLLWLYGPRKLTKASDKLPAIAGLADIFSKRLNDEYVAGLWRSRLVEELLWQGLKCRRVQEYRSPTWSWASMDGVPGQGVIYDDDDDDNDSDDDSTLATILDVSVALKGSNTYGEVTDAKIQIQAPMERLYLAANDWDPNGTSSPYSINPKMRTATGQPEGTYSRLDFDFTAEDAPQEVRKIVADLEEVDIYALILMKLWNENMADDVYASLIVKKAAGSEEYQRLGYISLDRKILGQTFDEQLKGEFPIITLV